MRFRHFSAAFFLFTVCGCGGGGGTTGTGASSGSGGGGGNVDGGAITSVSGSKPLNTLTTAEQNAICLDDFNYGAQHSTQADKCKYQGFAAAQEELSVVPTTNDSDVRTACMNAYNSCIAAAQSDAGTVVTCNLSGVSSCAASATVSQLSVCDSDTVVAFNLWIATIPACNALTVAQLAGDAGIAGMPPNPASCTALAQLCPALASLL